MRRSVCVGDLIFKIYHSAWAGLRCLSLIWRQCEGPRTRDRRGGSKLPRLFCFQKLQLNLLTLNSGVQEAGKLSSMFNLQKLIQFKENLKLAVANPSFELANGSTYAFGTLGCGSTCTGTCTDSCDGSCKNGCTGSGCSFLS